MGLELQGRFPVGAVSPARLGPAVRALPRRGGRFYPIGGGRTPPGAGYASCKGWRHSLRKHEPPARL